MALSKAISFLVICFSSVKKILIYDTISPTPNGKGRMMVEGAAEKQGKVAPPPGAPLCASIKYYTHGKMDMTKNGGARRKRK